MLRSYLIWTSLIRELNINIVFLPDVVDGGSLPANNQGVELIRDFKIKSEATKNLNKKTLNNDTQQLT